MNNGVQRGQGNLEKFYRALHLSGRRRVTTIFFFSFLAGAMGSVGEGNGEFKSTGLILA